VAKDWMPILATGIPNNSATARANVPDAVPLAHCKLRTGNEQGFTLLEIMLVVVIIGVLVSIFTLSVGSFADDQNAEHARRLEALLQLASEEAAIQGRELGLNFYQHGYEFSARTLTVDAKGLQQWLWVPLDDDQLLQPRTFGEDYAIELLIDGKEVKLEYQRTEPTEKKPYEPQIFLFSSGEVAPAFSAVLRQSFSDELLQVNVDTDGKVEIKADAF
jgi:general secretion pathway protein H